MSHWWRQEYGEIVRTIQLWQFLPWWWPFSWIGQPNECPYLCLVRGNTFLVRATFFYFLWSNSSDKPVKIKLSESHPVWDPGCPGKRANRVWLVPALNLRGFPQTQLPTGSESPFSQGSNYNFPRASRYPGVVWLQSPPVNKLQHSKSRCLTLSSLPILQQGCYCVYT